MNEPAPPPDVPGEAPPCGVSHPETAHALAGAATPGPEPGQAQFVAWLRDVAPYVHAHRGRTFVVGFGGELIESGRLNALVNDLSLLQAMGIRLVLVHGSRPQVQKLMDSQQLPGRFASGLRITDCAALEHVKEAAGAIRLSVEAAFSQGLPNTPMANARVRIVSGNFVIAKPVGIIDGVDFKHTGLVRKIDIDAVRAGLDSGYVVLLPPLGFSPTGEAFNLTMQDVASAAAIALKAEKLLLMGATEGVRGSDGEVLKELSAADAERMLAQGAVEAACAADLQALLKACRGGVSRAHLVPAALDGGILVDLFTHDGVGTMITPGDLESLREAVADDVGGILRLIAPLEADGTLVKRPRELIERDITQFSVLEHDGIIFGCAALIPFPGESMGEMACLTVHVDYREAGDGDRLMRRIEARARAMGLRRLFVLTTRTMHWFLKRGFTMAGVDDLPAERQHLYNWQRRSQVLIKNL